MQRRSFFGVLGGLLALLGWEKKAAAQTTMNGLPIIQFDDRGGIANLEEIFTAGSEYELDQQFSGAGYWSSPRYIAKAWLRKEDAWKVGSMYNVTARFGPVYLYQEHGHRQIFFFACVESLRFSSEDGPSPLISWFGNPLEIYSAYTIEAKCIPATFRRTRKQ